MVDKQIQLSAEFLNVYLNCYLSFMESKALLPGSEGKGLVPNVIQSTTVQSTVVQSTAVQSTAVQSTTV